MGFPQLQIVSGSTNSPILILKLPRPQRSLCEHAAVLVLDMYCSQILSSPKPVVTRSGRCVSSDLLIFAYGFISFVIIIAFVFIFGNTVRVTRLHILKASL